MKIVKGLLTTLLWIGILFGYTVDIKAEDVGYYYEKLHVNVDITDAREYRVRETMDITFEEAMHGIVRDIPKSSTNESYSIKNIQVEGMPFTIDERQSYVAVRIGDENQKVTGTQHVTMSYTLQHYQDYDTTYDYAYLNLLGTDYDCDVRDFSADVTFPSPEKLLNYRVSSGLSGYTTNNYTDVESHDNTLHIQSRKTLPARHGVTLQMKYQDGVFANAPEYTFPYVIHSMENHIQIDEAQDLMVEQTLKITVNNHYTRIAVAMVQGDWAYDSYKVSDIECEGEDSKTTYYEKNHISILVKQPGEKVIKLRYKVHPYHIMENMKISMFHKDEETKLENYTLTMQLPKGTKFTTAKAFMGRSNENRLLSDAQLQANTLTLTSNTPVYEGDQLYIEVPLDKSFYHRETSQALTIAILFCIGFTILLAILRLIVFRKKKLIVPVNFYPPNNMSPAEAGYIIDMKLSDTDMTSMIFYWADKGYLKISDIDSCFCFEKQKDIDDSAPAYERKLFYGMFAHGVDQKVYKKDLMNRFYRNIQVAKKELRGQYRGAKLLRSNTVEMLRKGLLLLSILPAFLLNVVYQYIIYEEISKAILTSVIYLPILIFAILILRFVGMYRDGSVSKGAIIAISIVLGVILMVMGIPIMIVLNENLPMMFAGFAISLICLLLAYGIHYDTPYRNELLAQLYGFRDFIRLAEKDQLETMLQEDPEYYYHVLPYAQVLHVSDIWENKFRSIALEAPSWYESDQAFQYIAFHQFIHTVDNAMHLAVSPPASSGSGSGSSGGFSGGGGGFSGGGFSGGGSGGGGSHGW